MLNVFDLSEDDPDLIFSVWTMSDQGYIVFRPKVDFAERLLELNKLVIA